MSKSLEKKRKKEKDLYDTAYNLFTTKGVKDTAISEIAKNAGVGKGTFYLYFKDKYDILNKLIVRKTSTLIKTAIDDMHKENIDTFTDQIIYIIDYIIEYLKNNTMFLKMVHKNLSWGLYKKVVSDMPNDDNQDNILNILIQGIEEQGLHLKNPEITIFFIFELVGSICYSSIINNEPLCMDDMKPYLIENIMKIIGDDKEK